MVLICKYICFFIVLFFYNCSSKEIKIDKKTINKMPSRIYKNAIIDFSDEGQDLFKAKAKLILEYGFNDTVSTYFPKGIELTFIDNKTNKKQKLFADRAKIIAIQDFYEASGNVKVINAEGDTLKTSKIFWQKKNKIIFAPNSATIIKKDNSVLTAQNGLEASEDLKSYKLMNNSGYTNP